MPKALAIPTVDHLLHHAHVIITGGIPAAGPGDDGEGDDAPQLKRVGPVVRAPGILVAMDQEFWWPSTRRTQCPLTSGCISPFFYGVFRRAP